jgi:hypothetical protein
MSKWSGLNGPITATDADAEPEAQRLFSQPKRPISNELARLLARLETKRRERARRRSQVDRKDTFFIRH